MSDKRPGQDGNRYNEGKIRWSLVDFEAIEPMVRVLEFGAQKYSSHQWKQGLSRTEVCESLMRHLFAYLNGEDNDQESGLPHIGHIQCNAMFLAYMHKHRPDLDDRFQDKNKQCCGNWDCDGNCKCNEYGPKQNNDQGSVLDTPERDSTGE